MKRGHKGTETVLFLIYAAVVLRITVFRSSFTLQDLCQNGKIILTPFEGYIDLLRSVHLFVCRKYRLVCPVWHVSAVYGDIGKTFSDGSLRVFVFPVDRIDAVCVWNRFFGAGRSRSEHARRVDRGSGGDRVQAIDLFGVQCCTRSCTAGLVPHTCAHSPPCSASVYC